VGTSISRRGLGQSWFGRDWPHQRIAEQMCRQARGSIHDWSGLCQTRRDAFGDVPPNYDLGMTPHLTFSEN
jgi:hypothetical protein